MFTYVVARKSAIIRRMSASLLVVSSNPGVSINATIRPSSSNGCATLIISVQDSSPAPTRRSDPLARLINYAVISSDVEHVLLQPTLRTVVFPVPVAPITLLVFRASSMQQDMRSTYAMITGFLAIKFYSTK